MKILEIKRHINKPDETYWCDLVGRGDDCLVLQYVSERSGRVGEVNFDPGSVTYAHYRSGRGYVLWRMAGPGGNLKGHLFHICRDQVVGDDWVSYLDLLLDVWIDPAGGLTVLDRDEVEACAASGAVGKGDLAWIAEQERAIRKNRRRMIAELDSFHV